MRSRGQFSPYRWLFVAAIAAMLLVPLSGVAAGSPNPPGASTTVSLPEGANIVTLTLDGGQKDAYPGLDGQLSQLAAAYQKGDQAALAAFAGERHVDLAQGSARVILEMAVDPQAQTVGGPTYQQVALPGGRMATVEHAPRVAIRAELAAAIAATGATYETAYESWVQVLARVNPMNYEVSMLRGLLLGQPTNYLADLTVLIVAGVVGIAVASSLMGRLSR